MRACSSLDGVGGEPKRRDEQAGGRVVELHTRLFEAVMVMSAKGGRVPCCGFCFLSFLTGT